MELVVDDLGHSDLFADLLAAVSPDALLEGLAHVDDRMGDGSGPLLAERQKRLRRFSERPSTTLSSSGPRGPSRPLTRVQ